ncbi:hypothetical protein SDC9_150246 [bioreactor metagenome]|uniref:Uncharacterized protein n=1 Tax=bioreactor metagenome TaxID=1076179 RepID=A0A645ER66_9ZZZZ
MSVFIIKNKPASKTPIPIKLNLSGFFFKTTRENKGINTKYADSTQELTVALTPEVPRSTKRLKPKSSPDNIRPCRICFLLIRNSSPQKRASIMPKPIRFVIVKNAKFETDSGTFPRKTYCIAAKKVMIKSERFASSLFISNLTQ